MVIIHEILRGMPHRTEQADGVDGARPEWFAAFLADRGTRKPSAHTIKAYRQDFDAIATLIAGGGDLSGMPVGAITIDTLRTAFAQFAETHEAASIQRCWSTWNVLCTFLYTAELIAANPMPMVGRPKLAKTLPKALPADAVGALLGALNADQVPRRRTDWIDRDRALILTALLAGMRADELVRANVGDLRRTDDGAVIHVRGKGGKDRRIPIEPALVEVLERYLDGRATRFPATVKRRSFPGGGLTAWPSAAPLFVGADGERITRGTLQYRVLRAFRRAGIDADRARGALVHGLRHTFATELANADVSVYTLMKLLGHESMVTSQRYVTAAGTETRTAAAQNKLYGLLAEER
jgi:integrase/recombinase XerC